MSFESRSRREGRVEPQVPDCPGCGLSVRLSKGELERIVADYFGGQVPKLASKDETARRLSVCLRCNDLLYGSTCRHCGCLVEIRAHLADGACPAPEPRW